MLYQYDEKKEEKTAPRLSMSLRLVALSDTIVLCE